MALCTVATNVPMQFLVFNMRKKLKAIVDDDDCLTRPIQYSIQDVYEQKTGEFVSHSTFDYTFSTPIYNIGIHINI